MAEKPQDPKPVTGRASATLAAPRMSAKAEQVVSGGMGKAQVRAENIRDNETLLAWVDGVSPTVAGVVLARLAMRLLPLTFDAVTGNEGQDWELVLHAFVRMISIRRRWLDGDPLNLSKLPNADTVYATDFSQTASRASGVVYHALRAIDVKNQAAWSEWDLAMSDVVREHDMSLISSLQAEGAVLGAYPLGQIRADARLASQNYSVESLLTAPLWDFIDENGQLFSNALPHWINERLVQASTMSQFRDGPWGILLAWYLAASGDPRASDDARDLIRPLHYNATYFLTRSISAEPNQLVFDIAEFVDWPASFPESVRDIRDGRLSEQPRHGPLPKPAPEPQPEIIDQTRLHGDQPTSDDLLGRQTFARGLVETIDQVLDEQQVWLEGERQKLTREGRLEQLDGDGFAVHLHAPWGAGKTSVLKMMETRMTSRRRKDSNRWIVVNFNAWRHEKRVPPWRPLIEGLKRDIVRGLDERGHYTPRVNTDCYWSLSNFHARFGPYIYAAGILIVAFVAVSWASALPPIKNIIGEGAVTNVVSFVVSLLTAFGAFMLFGQNIVFGSKKDAEIHAAHSHDPLKRHRIIFRKLLNYANSRVCIFIDDLDRCSASYVVDLLEGVQTAFRHENVVYVVAADKNWIRTAFEDAYKPFNRQSEVVGQSLGYLFLEKIFQVSTSLPGMGDAVRKSYLGGLVTDSKGQEVTDTQESLPQTIEAFDEAIDEKRDALREFAEGDVTREVADEWLELNQTAADRAAAGLEIVFSAELEKEFTHRLQSFEHLLPDNPRVIKRLVNAYGFRTLVGFSENSSVPPDVLVRWTILEQRFPDAANSFTEHPDWVDQIAGSKPPVGDKILPPRLRMFANSAAIREVIGDGDGRLHTADVRRLTRGLRA